MSQKWRLHFPPFGNLETTPEFPGSRCLVQIICTDQRRYTLTFVPQGITGKIIEGYLAKIEET
jgi:hypothetical protein